MSSRIDDRGELTEGVSAKEVRSEVSESSSRDIVVVVVTTEGAFAASRLAAYGEIGRFVGCNDMRCLWISRSGHPEGRYEVYVTECMI